MKTGASSEKVLLSFSSRPLSRRKEKKMGSSSERLSVPISPAMLNILNKDAEHTSNFQPIRFLYPGCWYPSFTYLITNSADPNQY